MNLSPLTENVTNITPPGSLSRRQLDVMESLAAKDGQTIKELSLSIGVLIYQPCTALERLELIVVRLDQNDSRIKKIYLTPRGKSFCLTLSQKFTDNFAANKYDHITRFFVRSNKKPRVPFSDLLPIQQSILVEMANSVVRDGYTPTRSALAMKLGILPNIVQSEMRELYKLGYVDIQKGCRIIRLVIHESEGS